MNKSIKRILRTSVVAGVLLLAFYLVMQKYPITASLAGMFVLAGAAIYAGEWLGEKMVGA